MRNTLAALAILVVCSVNAEEPKQRPVAVELGPKAYRDGDVVQITNVTSTSALLEQGDTVTVSGRVRLDSAADGRLCLHLTQTEGDGQEETDPTQVMSVNRGLTSFRLTTTIKHRGVLHLTLYHKSTGKPFGGVYFGTKEQLEPLSPTWVRHYLSD